jgi:hypothetical protein
MKRIAVAISIVIAALGAPGVAYAAHDSGPVAGISPLPEVVPVVQTVVDTALGTVAGIDPIALAEQVADAAPDACAAALAPVLPLPESIVDDSIVDTVIAQLDGLLPGSVDSLIPVDCSAE